MFKKLESLEKRIGYCFKTRALLKQALTHKSAHRAHNERLEFLGDAVLSMVIADALYLRFNQATEGELTRARASLVNKTTLSSIALELSLGDYIELGLGEKRSGGFRRESIMADALEAIFGAVYLDSGFDDVKKVILSQYEQRMMALRPEKQQKDPKTQLQEWLQANQHSLPKYEITLITGEPHDQHFTVICEVEALSLQAEGEGSSRRLAEQEAARKILEHIK